MGGNVWEWTTEKYLTRTPIVNEDGSLSSVYVNIRRGGACDTRYRGGPDGGGAGSRRQGKDETQENLGFRVSLFL